jgi:uncharacterized protein YndB with AHSA1/START domain
MIDHEIHIEAPADLVFAMLTESSLLLEWLAVEARVEARPGGVLRWVHANGDVVLGRFVELDPPRRVVFTYGWEQPTDRGVPPESTTVEITLDEVAGGTTLRLQHRGLPGPVAESHRHGWIHFLRQLRARAGTPR